MNATHASASPRSFSLGLYLLIVFGLSWPFLIAGAVWATDLVSLYLLNCAAMVMVTVGTFIAGRYVFRDGFANAGWHWGKPRHYLAIVGLIVLLWVFPTLVRLAVGTVELSSIDRTKIVWLFVLPLVLLIPGFGEEFGWRGYMLPHLFRHLGARKAVVLQGVIWWAWHLPVFVGTGIRAGIAGAPEAGIPVGLSVAVSVIAVVVVGAIPTILHGIVIAYIWVRSQSLAVATVYHALYDGVRDSLTMVIGVPSMVGLWASVVLTVLGAILLWKGNWKYPEAATTGPESPNPATT
jgi:membrane protease YdiL (CAAX protease family)